MSTRELRLAEIVRRKRMVEIARDYRLRRQRYAPRYQPLAPFEIHVWHEKRVLNERSLTCCE